jgi:hypothetical protein
LAQLLRLHEKYSYFSFHFLKAFLGYAHSDLNIWPGKWSLEPFYYITIIFSELTKAYDLQTFNISYSQDAMNSSVPNWEMGHLVAKCLVYKGIGTNVGKITLKCSINELGMV